eukprot:4555354-Amphidinium_carterae.2
MTALTASSIPTAQSRVATDYAQLLPKLCLSLDAITTRQHCFSHHSRIMLSCNSVPLNVTKLSQDKKLQQEGNRTSAFLSSCFHFSMPQNCISGYTEWRG